MHAATHSIARRVVVVGGGMAGLLAARVLTEYCQHVTLVERDRYPAEPVFRPGVPQARHVHVLLVQGQKLLEELFPGFLARLVERGAVRTDVLGDYAIRYPTGWLPRIPSDLTFYCCTRSLLEWQVRQEVLRTSMLEIIEGCEVTDLLFDAAGRAVSGVRVREREIGQGQCERDLMADLVIDASGRDSRILRWLEAGKFPLPAETVVNPALGYASCFYKLAPVSERSWRGIVMATNPPRLLRGGSLIPVEGDRWHVVLAGVSGDYPPTDPDEFLDFARGMLDPSFADALAEGERISPVYGYRRTENRWRHFEKLRRFPEGLLVMGDAVCAFDPIYGQGMTAAAIGAFALKTCLARQPAGRITGLAWRYRRTLARLNRIPWNLSTGADYRALPPAEQTRGWLARQINRYLDRLTAILPASPKVCLAFVRVLHLLESPLSLFHPVIAWIVFTSKNYDKSSS